MNKFKAFLASKGIAFQELQRGINCIYSAPATYTEIKIVVHTEEAKKLIEKYLSNFKGRNLKNSGFGYISEYGTFYTFLIIDKKEVARAEKLEAVNIKKTYKYFRVMREKGMTAATAYHAAHEYKTI